MSSSRSRRLPAGAGSCSGGTRLLLPAPDRDFPSDSKRWVLNPARPEDTGCPSATRDVASHPCDKGGVLLRLSPVGRAEGVCVSGGIEDLVQPGHACREGA